MLTVTVNSKPVDDLLTKLQRQLGDLRPAMEGVGQELNSRISARFETRTDPLGKAWAPWAESTRDSYPKDGRGLLLERYGHMLKSLNFQANSTSVRVGFGAVASKTGDVYAAYHEFGTVKMPRRGLLFADPNARTLAPADEAAVRHHQPIFIAGIAHLLTRMVKLTPIAPPPVFQPGGVAVSGGVS